MTRNIFNTVRGWAFLGCFAVCIAMIADALARWGAQEVRQEEGARVFLTLAISEDPDREDLRRELARISQNSLAAAAEPRTLAELIP